MTTKKQTNDGVTARSEQSCKTELLSWVQGICCAGGRDHWKAELLEKILTEREALQAVADAAKEARTMLDGMARTPEIRKVWAKTGFELSARESLLAIESALFNLQTVRGGKAVQS